MTEAIIVSFLFVIACHPLHAVIIIPYIFFDLDACMRYIPYYDTPTHSMKVSAVVCPVRAGKDTSAFLPILSRSVIAVVQHILSEMHV